MAICRKNQQNEKHLNEKSFNLPVLLCKECKRHLTYLEENFAPCIFI